MDVPMKPKSLCPVCRRRYTSIEATLNHLDSEHPGCCPQGVTEKQWLFNVRNKLPPANLFGKSILSGKNTPWNEKLGKYERLASEAERKEFRALFVKRMMKVHGKSTLLRDPDIQKSMLRKRKISGKYNFQGVEFDYTGTYELDFLRHIDEVMNWDPKDLFMPCPIVIDYICPRDGKWHFYIPDAYIQSLSLIIEIKSQDNKFYRKRDLDIETAKDKAVGKLKKLSYVKIYDKDYSEFMSVINELKNS